MDKDPSTHSAPRWRPDVHFSDTLGQWTAMVPFGAPVTYGADGFVGFGATPDEAIADLMQKLPEGDRL